MSQLDYDLQKLDGEQTAYDKLLEVLRAEDDPGEWDAIIESMGWGDADYAQIIEDI